jgi:mycothiol synthase
MASMVEIVEIVAPSGPSTCDDLGVSEIELRVPSDDDVVAVSRVVDAQDTAWWGEPDGDVDDLRDEFRRVELTMGSLDVGARVAVVDGEIVGVALRVGHGHTSVAVDPGSASAAAARRELIAWLAGFGDVEIESPAHDAERLDALASFGFVPHRSSFELERRGDVADLPEPSWPSDIVPVGFRPGVDDEELHTMIYSFWTDVAGHTQRPLDEWRGAFLEGSWFDAGLIVVTRAEGGSGPIVGAAINRTFNGDVGWVSQLGVAHSARGLGLGRAILIESCRRLGRLQPRIIGLGVEAENANALGLYRSIGMEIAREWVHCTRARQ